MPRLYLIPLPLAPEALDTLAPQVQAVVATVDYVLAEELRTARRFVSSLKTGRKIDQIPFFQLDKHTSQADLAAFLKLVQPTQTVGVMSEAGCPGIADPGALAVQYAHAHGWEVVPLVGPSSLLLALMGSGLNGQGFTFHGYLPVKREEAATKAKALERTARQTGQAQLFIETPYRNNGLLGLLLTHLQPDTRLCIAANLTAPDGFVRTKKVSAWKTAPPDLHKIPVVFIIQ
ncbi:MAG: SAM-dependent methyltransferase [Bernardetiaceae bacterium]|jgi:16S rRNA (cytidine1402-2'-O)-methyltransferase|nr:SAM-dependent methyltransferase [Bernardetiaceae bacterium]